MELSSLQQQIDAIKWYHEFDFGDGLRTRSADQSCGPAHRTFWKFIEERLNTVNFQGKSVLDIGAWDGFWSFYAERRGAKRILATDDLAQNWSDGRGIHLAKELYKSAVQINQNMSVYQLASLNEKFDIILFLGVYYHLFDPFYAFAQVRHCCHPGTLLLVEGAVTTCLGPGEAYYNFSDNACEWLPSLEALQQIIHATYFSDADRAFLVPFEPARNGERVPPLTGANRVFMTCVPVEAAVQLYGFCPPQFGLGIYDPRFR
jgi:tRNA (mo5U34)-methyltransferase